MADAPLLPLSFGSFITLWHCCSSLSPRARLAGAIRATVARLAAGASLAAEFARVLLSKTLLVTLLVFGDGFINLLADSGRHYVRDLQHAYATSLMCRTTACVDSAVRAYLCSCTSIVSLKFTPHCTEAKT